MADEQVVNWLKENQTRGYSLDQLKDILVQQGHSQQDVNEAVSLISKSETKQEFKPSLTTKTAKKSKKVWWILGSTLTVFLGFFLLLALLPSSQNISNSQNLQNVQSLPAPVIQALEEPIAPISNYAFTQDVMVMGSTIGDKKTTFGLAVAGYGIYDVVNKDLYSNTQTTIRSITEGNTKPEDITMNSEIYVVNGTSYSKIDMGIINGWIKLPVLNDTSTADPWSTVSASGKAAEFKEQISSPDYTIELISENPIKIRFTAKDDSPAMEDAMEQFEAIINLIGGLFEQAGMEFSASNAKVESLIIESTLDESSRPSEIKTTMNFSADVVFPTYGKCITLDPKNPSNCLKWNIVNESAKMEISMSMGNTFVGYNQQDPIVVPQEALNAGTLPLSADQISDIAGSLSEEEKAQMQDILSGLS